MKALLTLLILFCLTAVSGYAQEICDNALDDDGDGLIDMNDPDCECDGFYEIESLIPNHSFEDYTCCPMSFSQLTCADTWIQASGATSDYFNLCGVDGPEDILPIILNPEFPLPGDGDGAGYVGFISQNGIGTGLYNEYVGACLEGPMEAGVTYILNLYVARGLGEEFLNLSIYGTPDCGDLPWVGFECPVDVGDWDLLANTAVTMTEATAWYEVTITFVPPIDINAIAIGGPCDPEEVPDGDSYNYYYLDELTLLDFDSFYGMESEGGWCSGDLVLTAETDTVGGSWQWYKDGIALLGETDAEFNPIPYGEGNFDAVYRLDDYCAQVTYSSPETGIVADFTSESFCFPGESVFENTSIYESDDIWFEWDFGDGNMSFADSPTHTYDEGGIYDVTLIAHSLDSTCNDTVTAEYTIGPKPEAEIDFTAEGLYIWGDNEVVCKNNVVNFIDASTVGPPSNIVGWTWYIDGEIYDVQNPDHFFDAYGVYDIDLVVETESGCTDSTHYAELYVTEIVVDFTTTDQCELEEVTFDNETTFLTPESPGTWEWDFGDGGTADTEDATHIYDEPGTYEVELVVVSEEGCTDSITNTVNVYPLPVAHFEFIVDGVSSEDGATGGCYTNPVQFSSLATIDPPSIIDTWFWTFGDGETSTEENPVHLYDMEGTYTVELTVTTDVGCQHSIAYDIVMTNGITGLSNDTTICQNGMATLLATGSEGGAFSYDWSIPGSDNGPEQDVDGLTEDYWVYVTATDESGCSFPTDSVLITVLDPITLEISAFDTACVGETTNPTVTPTGGRGDYTYVWTGNGASIAGDASSITDSPLIPTVYCVVVSDGCETDPVEICTQTYVPEFVSFTSDKTEGCEPTEITFTDLTGPDPLLNESTWYINGEVLYGNPVSYLFEEAGSYTITLDVLSPEGCVTRGSVNNYITIHPLPEPEFYATPNPTTYFNPIVELVNINPNISSDFYWKIPDGTPDVSDSDSLVEVIYPELVSGNYVVTLIETTEFGCVDSIQNTIIINNDQIIYAPNTFTPDGDNFNDDWGIFIEGIDIYDFHLTLFNRWGEIVWESYNPTGRWDGSYGGELVQDGVYVWVIRAKDLEYDKAYEFRGTVNVLK